MPKVTPRRGNALIHRLAGIGDHGDLLRLSVSDVDGIIAPIVVCRANHIILILIQIEVDREEVARSQLNLFSGFIFGDACGLQLPQGGMAWAPLFRLPR